MFFILLAGVIIFTPVGLDCMSRNNLCQNRLLSSLNFSYLSNLHHIKEPFFVGFPGLVNGLSGFDLTCNTIICIKDFNGNQTNKLIASARPDIKASTHKKQKHSLKDNAGKDTNLIAAKTSNDNFMLTFSIALCIYLVALVPVIYLFLFRWKKTDSQHQSSGSQNRQAQSDAVVEREQKDRRSDEAILDLHHHWDKDSLRAAYRLKCQQLHPDKWIKMPDDFQIMMENEYKAVQKAYAKLSKIDSAF